MNLLLELGLAFSSICAEDLNSNRCMIQETFVNRSIATFSNFVTFGEILSCFLNFIICIFHISEYAMSSWGLRGVTYKSPGFNLLSLLSFNFSYSLSCCSCLQCCLVPFSLFLSKCPCNFLNVLRPLQPPLLESPFLALWILFTKITKMLL